MQQFIDLAGLMTIDAVRAKESPTRRIFRFTHVALSLSFWLALAQFDGAMDLASLPS
jgi:hypothetical protein